MKTIASTKDNRGERQKKRSGADSVDLHREGSRLAKLYRRMNEAGDRLGEAQDISRLAEKHKQAMQRELIERYREYEAAKEAATDASRGGAMSARIFKLAPGEGGAS
jgi:hypothetical protein